jgi:pimeloyl-ACP methyl ester carboxylesterase
MTYDPTVLSDWGGRSLTADLGGAVHYVDFGGPEAGPRVVLVHGLGGSHLNWCLLAPEINDQARVFAIDLPGFGLTEPAGRSSAVADNVAVLDRFVRDVVGAPVVLIGNSMGGMISILEAAAAPDAVRGLVLLDPSVPPARPLRVDPLVALRFAVFALPGVGTRFLARQREKLGARRVVRGTLRLCGLDLERFPAELVDQSVAMLESRRDAAAMDRAFVRAARSLLRVNAHPRRYWSAMRAIRVPVLMVHGGRDRLVPLEAARQAATRHPAWRLEVWPEAGHTPQLEQPERLGRLLLDWLDTL